MLTHTTLLSVLTQDKTRRDKTQKKDGLSLTVPAAAVKEPDKTFKHTHATSQDEEWSLEYAHVQMLAAAALPLVRLEMTQAFRPTFRRAYKQAGLDYPDECAALAI